MREDVVGAGRHAVDREPSLSVGQREFARAHEEDDRAVNGAVLLKSHGAANRAGLLRRHRRSPEGRQQAGCQETSQKRSEFGSVHGLSSRLPALGKAVPADAVRTAANLVLRASRMGSGNAVAAEGRARSDDHLRVPARRPPLGGGRARRFLGTTREERGRADEGRAGTGPERLRAPVPLDPQHRRIRSATSRRARWQAGVESGRPRSAHRRSALRDRRPPPRRRWPPPTPGERSRRSSQGCAGRASGVRVLVALLPNRTGQCTGQECLL